MTDSCCPRAQPAATPPGAARALVRLPNWPEALAAEIARGQRTPFAWGTHDCLLYAADCVRAQTGVDLAADFRGGYWTLRGAIQILAAHGYDTPLDAIAARLPEIPLARAARGDVVVAELAYGVSAGVCLGARSSFAAPSGLLDRPTGRCFKLERCKPSSTPPRPSP
jgi:hypothetical protein